MTTYTITQAAKLSGLPESTLRYYENIGIIHPIDRNPTTKRRVYNDDDINLIVAVACLNATGFSIEDMKKYFENSEHGDVNAQIVLLADHLTQLEHDMHFAQLRIKYVQSKVDFWKLMESDDKEAIEKARRKTYAIADELKLPKALNR